MRGLLGRVVLAILVAAVAGCRAPARVRYEEGLARTPEPASHAVHSERLHELMAGLDRLSRQRLPQAMDTRGERVRRAEQIAAVGQALAESAGDIAGATGDAGLAPDERQEFVQLALELRRRAQELAETAPGLSEREMHERAAAVERACERCHARFRIPLDSD
jgi:cytochrome c556